ncbi:uncharacterized protein LOC9657419 [Selaginella moellendorffii]|uniref:uncharacterized protein LOC9657419 n=1 Tax=Selaginella moellendorffii TaxID=88036 RepID=UPI000D1C5694|nr:uncharacterized protein LOC9657419 [Selaginella moellendorffii]XP_024535046.1 uncharacterized protein LOC9657419 [Selaginella moellendorffii]|eukprot:XP_024535045.1 uncharacterized protein LOC9657419 [Selaginella moellendorffii]
MEKGGGCHSDGQEPTVWDYVVVSVIAVGCVIHIAGNTILIRRRDYKPIHARGVWLTSLSSVGGLIWVLATVVVMKHFPRVNKRPFNICSLWTFWLQACFGFALWLNCLTVRMGQLYLVTIRKMRVLRQDRLKLTVLPLVVLLSPTIVISTFASAKGAVKYCPDLQDCVVHQKAFAIVTICMLPLYSLIFFWFAFQLRNIMSQWNEFRQIRIGGIMSFFLFLLSVVTLAAKTYCNPRGRAFLSLAVAGAVFYYFWARNWEVIYNVICNEEEYFRNFANDLNRLSERSRSSHFERNPMERLVLVTKEDARSALQELKALQDDVSSLTQTHAQLQRDVCGGSVTPVPTEAIEMSTIL